MLDVVVAYLLCGQHQVSSLESQNMARTLPVVMSAPHGAARTSDLLGPAALEAPVSESDRLGHLWHAPLTPRAMVALIPHARDLQL